MTALRDALQRKHSEIAEAYKEKSRLLFRTQELYNKVKRKAELGQLEQAASDAVDSSIRRVPSSAVSNSESNTFLSPHFHDSSERSFPLSNGSRFDATGDATASSGSNLQRYESESQWPGIRPYLYGEMDVSCS